MRFSLMSDNLRRGRLTPDFSVHIVQSRWDGAHAHETQSEALEPTPNVIIVTATDGPVTRMTRQEAHGDGRGDEEPTGSLLTRRTTTRRDRAEPRDGGQGGHPMAPADASGSRFENIADRRASPSRVARAPAHFTGARP